MSGLSSIGEVVAVSSATERWPSELVDCYRLNAAALTGYLVTLVGDSSLAQDLAQESFVRMFARWGHVEHPKAYVYLTAVNLARQNWRRSRYEAAANRSFQRLTADVEPASDPWLRDLVERLPKRLRTPVLLHYYADLPVEQVRDVMHLPLGTVKRRLHEARELLRQLLETSDA